MGETAQSAETIDGREHTACSQVGNDGRHDSTVLAGGLRAWTAMWWGVLWPGAAARQLAEGPLLSFAIAAVAQFAIAELVTLWLLSSDASLRSMSAPNAAAGTWGVFEYTLLFVPLALLALWLLVSFVSFPMAHRAGPPVPSIGKTARVAMLASGFIVVAATAAVASILGLHASALALASLSWYVVEFVLWALVALSCQAAIVTVIIRIDAGARAIASHSPAADVPPRCEGCGYELTHRPIEDRCPECGYNVTRSLTFGGVRNPPAVERQSGNFRICMLTLTRILFSPRRFYARLPVRDAADRARSLATANIVALSIAAGSWPFLTFTIHALANFTGYEPWLEVFCVSINLGVAIALAGHLLKRLIASGTAMFVANPHDIADGAWLVKPVAYETAWLWMFLIPSALMFSVAALGELPLRDFLGTNWAMRQFGIPAEVLLIFAWNVAMTFAWLYRWRIIRNAIRWNNF